MDEPVPVLGRGGLGHRHALPVAIAIARARHSLARSPGEAVAAHAKSGFPGRKCVTTNYNVLYESLVYVHETRVLLHFALMDIECFESFRQKQRGARRIVS